MTSSPLPCYYPCVKKGSTAARKALETGAFTLAVGIVNWFFPDNPGFFSGFFNPYLTLSLFIAVSYGKHYGFLALGISALEVALGLPLAHALAAGAGIVIPGGTWAVLISRAPLPFALAIIEVYLLGIIRDSLTRGDRKARDRLASLSRGAGLLKRQVRALQAANQELEERITGQVDSITSLYSQVEALSSLNLGKALNAILAMTARYIGATRCSIWQHRPAEKRLALAASIGRDPADASTTLVPDDGTIEGWVVRNASMFSVKMLLANDALARMDAGRSILSMPLIAGKRPWGVLNVEEMPFARYNLYSERLLQVIVALAAPALERAVEFESVLRQEDMNEVTGLPSFPELYAMLQLEMARLAAENGTLAVLVLEVANTAALTEEHGREGALLLMRDVARLIEEAAGGQARVYHYKADSQLAVMLPRTDADGASLVSLNVLEKSSAAEWAVKGERVLVDIVLGFAARSRSEQTADDLLEAAENLLEMQKV